MVIPERKAVLKKYNCHDQLSFEDLLQPEEIRVFGSEGGLDVWKTVHCSTCSNCYQNGKEKYCRHTDCINNGYKHYKHNRPPGSEASHMAQISRLQADKHISQEYIDTTMAYYGLCKYSGHECNKEELWKVACSLDDIHCPHTCCRQCRVKGCGARCNGSKEPNTHSSQKELPERFAGWTADQYLKCIVEYYSTHHLLQIPYRKTVEKLAAPNNVFDGCEQDQGKGLLRLFRDTMFKYSNTFFFFAEGECFALELHKNEQGISENGSCSIYHCGTDNNVVLAHPDISDVALQIIKIQKNKEIEK